MEKGEALELIRNDLAAFNKWKQENARERLDLSGADLSGTNLQEAQLGQVNLSEAILRGANLTGAMLAGSNLSNADLAEADLTGANMHRVNFSGANLKSTTVGGLSEEGRMCLTTASFEGVAWEKEQLEEMLRIINLNRDWDIQYQIIPKKR